MRRPYGWAREILNGRATVLGEIVIQASFCAQSQNLAGDGADLARILRLRAG